MLPYLTFPLLQVIHSSDSWKSTPKVVHHCLENLVTIMLKSRSVSTAKTYERAINKFFQWCKNHDIPLQLPFHVSIIALFLVSKAQESKSVSSVQIASAALKWLHSFTPDNNPNNPGGEYCPVTVLLKYMVTGSIGFHSPDLLFRPLVFHKQGAWYSLGKGSLSYSRSREIFKEALEILGFDSKEYGLHSLRSGGVTSVVLKLHGRWKTDTAKDMYVEESLASRLKVSSYLGL